MVSAADTLVDSSLSSPRNGAVNTVPMPHYDHPLSKPLGRQSEFWQVALPMISSRYIGRVASLLGKWDDPANPLLVRRAYGIIVGTVMASAMAFHTLRTGNDMKAIFAESVANELAKNPDDLKPWDYTKSSNTIVQDAVHNVKRFSLRRIVFTVLPFFNFLIPFVSGKIDDPNVKFDISNSVDAGVGSTGGYLGGEIMMGRQPTLFENITRFIKETKNTRLSGGEVSSAQIMDCYMPFLRENKAGKPESPEWSNAIQSFMPMASQIAEMINAIPASMAKDAKYPMILMNDLLGHGLIQLKPDKKTGQENLAFMEIASRYGIPAIQDMAKELKAGKSFEEVTGKYPVMRTQQPEAETDLSLQEFNKIFEKEGSHASKVGQRPVRSPAAPSASHAENALKSSEFEYQRV